MYFDFSDDNKMVQRSVKSMFKDHSSMEEVRAFMSNPIIPDRLKNLLASQGLIGILDTRLEKDEQGIETSAIVLNVAGQFLLTYPLLETLVGLNVLKKFAHFNEIISKVEDGNKMLTVAWECKDAQAIQFDDTFRLNGILRQVPFAANSDFILANVFFRGTGDTPSEEETLIIIEAKNPKVMLKKVEVMDETYPLYEVYLNGYEVSEDLIIHEIGSGKQLYKEMFDLGTILMASEIIGSSERALNEAVDYTKYRKQFGVEISKFQAIKHMAAEMLLNLESSKIALQYAIWALENHQVDSELAVSIAKSYASEAALEITCKAIQMQGGIGFTWENDAHLFLKRVQRGSALFGDSYFYREKIAQLSF